MAIVHFKTGTVETVIGNLPQGSTTVACIELQRTGKDSWCADFPRRRNVDTRCCGPSDIAWGCSIEHAIGALLMKQVSECGAVISIDGVPIVIRGKTHPDDAKASEEGYGTGVDCDGREL